MSDETRNSFNRMKNILYKKNERVRTLEDVVLIIQKEHKSEEDKQLLKKIKSFVDSMIDSMNDLGTKSIVMNSSIDEDFFSGLELNQSDDVDHHVKDIVIIIDQFIDALSAMIRTLEFKNERFYLKKTEYYIKSYRNNLIKKLHEFKLKSAINNSDNQNFLFFVNDVIDVVIKEGHNLRLKKLSEVLERELS